MSKKPTMLWVGRSNNDKTGDIPQGYVGVDKAETERSCEGCPLRQDGCYHWLGARRAQASMQRAHAKDMAEVHSLGVHRAKEAMRRPHRYSLKTAISNSRRMARYVRGAVGGDPWIFDRETVEGWANDVREAGFRGMLLYTHFAADKGAHLQGLAMASVHSLEEADDRIDEGWRVALTSDDLKVPGSKRSTLKDLEEWSGETFTTPNGHRLIVCPAQHKAVDCNSCGLCDAQNDHHGAVPGVVFLKH